MKGPDSALVSAIALNAIFGNAPKFSHRLLDALGSADAVFRLSGQERLELFGPYNPRVGLIGPDALETAQQEYERLCAQGCQFVDIFSEHYPEALRECPDAPLLLYVRSETPVADLFGTRPAVAIVGTRDQSPYGRECCRRIVRALAEAPAKPLIVSGLALGVDITAHAAALEGNLPTIGVSPVGIDDVYPRRHAPFVARMCRTPGCALVTDYPPGTIPSALNFLRRNRIIAGLAGATLLVESRIKGGGMITARLAAGYGRDVFALPGRIDDLRSQGCNQLLQEQVAAPIASPETLPARLGLGRLRRTRSADLETAVRQRFESAFPAAEVARLVQTALLIRAERGIGLDELCRGTGLDYAEIARLTGLLEEEGFIEMDLLQRCTIKVKIA
ncbi:MAG: DNA-processing protein DprA [Bacteroidales bacterium]|nr:DNA-processing protein DprA [Bacteroidales bacterium]